METRSWSAHGCFLHLTFNTRVCTHHNPELPVWHVWCQANSHSIKAERSVYRQRGVYPTIRNLKHTIHQFILWVLAENHYGMAADI